MDTTLFQTPEWEKFKLATGYQGSFWVDDILVLKKNLPLGRSMLYSPLVSVEGRTWNVERFLLDIARIAEKSKAIFYRLEISDSDQRPDPLHVPHSTLHLQKAFEEMQPEHTLILDIAQSEEEILAQMKQKGRYNIKIAQRSGVTISSSDKSGVELDRFYELYTTMAKRQKISYRGKEYFEALLEILSEKQYARVYTAVTRKVHEIEEGHEKSANLKTNQEVPLAAAIIGFCGKRATYLFGGSSNEQRNLMAPYLLHWQIIQEAKAAGYTEYDFFGIAPDDNPNHPWAGVTRFKKQFGGEEVHLAGSWDLVFRPLEYRAFKIAEKIRR